MITPGFRPPAAKPGTSIAKAFRDLQREEENYRIPFQGDMRQWSMPGGTVFTRDAKPQVFLHPWRVFRRGARAATISVGYQQFTSTVNGVVPVIGKVLLDDASGPVLDLSTVGPNADLESYIFLQVTID